jgi:hypothetical protein
MDQKSNAATVPQTIDRKLNLLLSRLDCVKPCGTGKWLARCTVHPDKNPSLMVSLGHTGIVINCFAGCDKLAILRAIGLDFGDLFPDKPRHWRQNGYSGKKQQIPKFSRYELFDTLAYEAFVIHVQMRRILAGAKLTQGETERVDQAMQIIGNLSNEVHGK